MARHPALGLFLKAGMILVTYEQASATEILEAEWLSTGNCQ